ncbi:hypothetical protein [Legionella saoudiensis]|uniref:hypothetical protein n=1 Tax=Legionella saoudiensis TaxID=1750561 RepID=UPI00073058E4|nr:hypothetical protein [Legionella saoudiensis]
MSGNTMSKVMRTAVFALGLFASAACSAHGGGGWHGGGGGWHGGGWHGYYGGGGWWGPGVVIGAPLGGYYYDSGCQTVRVCNNYGHCWLQESCY